MTRTYQTAGDRSPSRNDHVWVRHRSCYRCCLCGATTSRTPPPFPTPADWLPDRYEELTDEERRLVPPERRAASRP